MRKPMEGLTMSFVYSFLFSILTTSTALDTITPSQVLRDGETIVSSNGSFELGFFNPANSESRYLGIWNKKNSTTTVVWVANRETSLSDTRGVLNFTSQGILVLLNSTKNIVWSSNTSRPAKDPVAQLLDSGNLVVKEGNDDNPEENILWQSFDYPCNIFLPGMKLGRNFVTGLDRFISSWESTEDPAQGQFSLRIDTRGLPQLVIKKGTVIQFRGGSWNGLRLTGSSRLTSNPIYTVELVQNEKEVYFKYEMQNSSILSWYVMNPSGLMQQFTWIDRTQEWVPFSTAPADQCDNYAQCGGYATCNNNKSPVCACLEGFVTKYPINWNTVDWSAGCVRRTTLDCSGGDGFMKIPGLKLPDTSSSWFNRTMSLKDCKGFCLKNCSCTAYANLDVRGEGSGCLLWFGELIDMKQFSEGGQDLYVRMAASELDRIRKKKQSTEKTRTGIIASFAVIASSAIIAILILGLILGIWIRKRRKQGMTRKKLRKDYRDECREEDMVLTIFDLTTIANATNNFSSSNKLGEGGFGPVYKGTLVEGQDIAVKRHSRNSGQGLEEFKNEVKLIAKLQHRNLVKLLGCCIQEDEAMLIYEYMPNKSLDHFIFDQSKSKLLAWHKRIHIIGGIARGLLYLHQDSRLRIIHRDLKASNILLDNDMNPKISDFGLARTFGGDQSVDETRRVVGTYGYMSPEYAVHGHFSVKSDIFSFGVIVLEILSGKKNRGFFQSERHLNLLGYAWTLWIEGRPLELIDKDDSYSPSEMLRCIHVALLCVQQRPEDRPNMSSVVLMLGSESELPQPKQPGFFMEIIPDASSHNHKLGSTNEITITMLEGR